MTSIQYLQFVTVADCHNITKAAKKLMIAQPALTNQIKRLEEELGVTLFIRSPRSVELTDAGHVFYKAAVKILQQEENARNDISLLKQGGGILRLGLTRFLPDVEFEHTLQNFKKKYPHVVISLYEGIKPQVLKLLENETIELAIISSPDIFAPEFTSRKLSSTRMYLCRSYDFPQLREFAPGEEIPLHMLKGIPLSLPRSLYDYISSCCQKEGFIPKVDAVSDSRHATLELAKIGNCAAFLSLNENALSSSEFLINPVQSPSISIGRHLVTYGNTVLSETALNFIRELIPEK